MAWLIAYGAVTKPMAPMEQLPQGDAGWHTLVSSLLTSTFARLHHYTTLATKYSSWKYLGVRTENPQLVDEIVFPQSKQEKVILEEACMS